MGLTSAAWAARRGLAAAGLFGVAIAAGLPARADCLQDFIKSAAAQLQDLDTQDQVASRSVTTRTDLKTGKPVAVVVTEHAPPDRTRTTLRNGEAGTTEMTITTHDRLWIGHGGAPQEVPATVARERIDAARQHLVAYRAHLAEVDWSKRAQSLTCTPDSTLDGHPAELFTFTDAETGLPTKLYVDPKTFQALRTDAAGGGFGLTQTVQRDPSIHIDLPATP